MSRCVYTVAQASNTLLGSIPLSTQTFMRWMSLRCIIIFFLCLSIFLSFISSSFPIWTFGTSTTLLQGAPQLLGSHPACYEAGSQQFHLRCAAFCTWSSNDTSFFIHPLQSTHNFLDLHHIPLLNNLYQARLSQHSLALTYSLALSYSSELFAYPCWNADCAAFSLHSKGAGKPLTSVPCVDRESGSSTVDPWLPAPQQIHIKNSTEQTIPLTRGGGAQCGFSGAALQPSLSNSNLPEAWEMPCMLCKLMHLCSEVSTHASLFDYASRSAYRSEIMFIYFKREFQLQHQIILRG